MPLSPHLKIPPKEAQKTHSLLISIQALNPNLRVQKDKTHIYFPIKKEKLVEVKKRLKDATFANKNEIPHAKQAKPIRELLKEKLTKEEFSHLLSSYDIVGDIAILEIPKELEKKQSLIANEILNSNKKIKTVAVKSSATEGKFRIRKITPIAGIKTTKAISVESGCKLKIDLNQAYYTNRFSSERIRIANQVKPNETIVALFSGICPYPIVIEKTAKNKPDKIIAIELNPKAHKLAIENIKLNKCKKITAICADAKIELKKSKYKNIADRILMPHPSASMDFLKEALNAIKSKGIIHLYTFAQKSNPKAPFKEAKEIAKTSKVSLKLTSANIVRPFSKDISQVCLDIKALKE